MKGRSEASEPDQEPGGISTRGHPDGLAFRVPRRGSAVKAADRAIRLAGEQKNDPMLRALEAARAPLAEHLVSMGLRRQDLRAHRPRGRS